MNASAFDVLIHLPLLLLLVTGCLFTLLGSVALVKLPTFFQRVHGPTKASTLGVGCILVASVLYHSVYGSGFHPRELLISLFLFLTAPVSAHMMGKAALSLMKDGLPPPAPGSFSTEAADKACDRSDDAPASHAAEPAEGQ